MGVASAISTGMSLFQTIEGAKEERAAKGAAENYKRQDLTNSFENLTPSSLGANIRREQQAILDANQIDATQAGGQRAIIGSAGRIANNSNVVNREIAADMDMQQKNIDFAKSEDQARIRSMQEARENADLAALSSQMQAGKTMKWQGISNGISSLSSAAGSESDDTTPQVESVQDKQLGAAPLKQQSYLPNVKDPTQYLSNFTQPPFPTFTRY